MQVLMLLGLCIWSTLWLSVQLSLTSRGFSDNISFLSSVGPCESHGIYPDEQDCRRFFQCYDREVRLVYCPEGLVFNSRKFLCDMPGNVPWCRTDFRYETIKNNNKRIADEEAERPSQVYRSSNGPRVHQSRDSLKRRRPVSRQHPRPEGQPREQRRRRLRPRMRQVSKKAQEKKTSFNHRYGESMPAWRI